MDDFGTGYASLQYLTELPFNEIKLDQGFTRKITRCMDCLAVTSAAVLIAQLTGKSLLAEGISRPEQLRLWSRLGGRRAQGYLFSPPLPLNAFQTWGRWLFLPATLKSHPVPPEHLALLMLENEDYHWRSKIPTAQCPVTQWLERESQKLGSDPDYQTIAQLHPLLHFGGVTDPAGIRKTQEVLNEAAERILARIVWRSQEC